MDYNNFGITFYITCIAFVFIIKINSIYSMHFYDEGKYTTKFFKEFPSIKYTWNTFGTPFGLRDTVLAASYVARKETKYQIEKALLIENMQPPVWADYVTHLQDQDGWNVKVYINKRRRIAECVEERLYEFLEPVEYTRDTHEQANKWVKEKSNHIVEFIPTRPAIKKLFQRDGLITLVNLNFMDTNWAKPFVNTYKKKVTIVNGAPLRGEMVQQENTFLYANLTDFGVEAIQLPLENGADVLILQPYNTTYLSENFKELKGKLENFDIRKISEKLKMTKLSVFFPALNSTRSGRRITQTVKELGIKLAFSKKDADFCKLTRCVEEAYISEVHQNTFLNTSRTSFRIGSVTDITWAIVEKRLERQFLADFDNDEDEEYQEEDEQLEDEEENEEEEDEGNFINLSGLVLERFVYAVIQNGTTYYMGSLVKFHNRAKINEFTFQ